MNVEWNGRCSLPRGACVCVQSYERNDISTEQLRAQTAAKYLQIRNGKTVL